MGAARETSGDSVPAAWAVGAGPTAQIKRRCAWQSVCVCVKREGNPDGLPTNPDGSFLIASRLAVQFCEYVWDSSF